jgi:DNA polymerase III subunit delta'
MSERIIIGNEKTIDRLKRSVKSGELSHSYIFEGPDGIGKKTLAMEFARIILCNSEERPCGSCSSCRKIESGNHPDLFVQKPEKKKNSVKAAYSVSDIERIQIEMRRKPNESEKKVFIITEGEKLSLDSQNKFLKTIEEPSENVVTLILVNNANTLLKTTVSRCQLIKLERVSPEALEKYLESRYGQVDRIDTVIAFADGNIGRAIELLKDEEFQSRRDRTIDMTIDIMEKDVTKVFSGLKFFEDEKEHTAEMLDIMMSWFRDLLVVQKTGSEKHLINKDKARTLKTQTEILTVSQIYDIVKRVGETKLDIDRNVNYQLAVELLLLKIQELSSGSK